MSTSALKKLIDSGEFQAVLDILKDKEDINGMELYWCAFSHWKLHPSDLKTAISLFDRSEMAGFDLYWISYWRAGILFTLGEYRRCIADCMHVLAKKPVANHADLTSRSIDALVGLAEREGNLDDLAVAVRSLSQHFFSWSRDTAARLRNIKPKILRVNCGDFIAFSYENDETAADSPKYYVPSTGTTPNQYLENWKKGDDIVLLLVSIYLQWEKDFVFLDIGSNLGSDSIRVAKTLQAMGKKAPIVAFEPGVMGKLLPFTLQENGLADVVKFEQLAVSSSDKPVIMFGEAGVSVNNRFVNRDAATEAESYLVGATSVVDYMDRHGLHESHPVMKIDTQGAEYIIWQGIKPVLERSHPSMLMEFSPYALDSMVNPHDFLREILSHFVVFDVGVGRGQAVEIEQENAEAAIQNIRSQSSPWTDILCISRGLPQLREIVELLRQRLG